MIWNYRRSLMDEYDSPRWRERVRMMSDAQVFAIWTRMHAIRKDARRNDSVYNATSVKLTTGDTSAPEESNLQLSFYDLLENE